SVPFSRPEASASRTARSSSRCEVTPTRFRNLRTSILNTSSLKPVSAIVSLGVGVDGPVCLGDLGLRAQPYAERAALADPGFHGDLPAVAPHQAVTHGKAQSGTARGVGREERVENVLESIGRNAAAVVAHADDDA